MMYIDKSNHIISLKEDKYNNFQLVVYDSKGNDRQLNKLNNIYLRNHVLSKNKDVVEIWEYNYDLYILVEDMEVVKLFQANEYRLEECYDLQKFTIKSFKKFPLRKIQSNKMLQSLLKQYIKQHNKLQIQNGTVKLDDDGKIYFVKSCEYLLNF